MHDIKPRNRKNPWLFLIETQQKVEWSESYCDVEINTGDLRNDQFEWNEEMRDFENSRC